MFGRDTVPTELYDGLQERYDALLEKYHALKLAGGTPPAPPAPKRARDLLTEAVHAKYRGEALKYALRQLAQDRQDPTLDDGDILRRIAAGVTHDEGIPV